MKELTQMYRIRVAALLAVALALLASPAAAQSSFTAKDAGGITQTFKSFNCTGPVICPMAALADATGAAFGTAGNPVVVSNAGTFAVQAAQSGTWNVTNAGTFLVQAAQSGTWNVANTGTFAVQSAPSTAAAWGIGATGSAVPANAHYLGMTQGGNLTGLTGTSGNLNVQCANCTGSGASAADEAAFTAGSSVLAPSGGFFQTTATNNPLTTGQQGMWQMTSTRAGFVNLRNNAGTEIGTTTTPLQVGAPSGAFASGAFASGSGADGWFVTFGTKADAATCATTNSAMACLRQIDADVQAGTTTFGSTLPVNGVALGFSSGGNLTAPSSANPLPVSLASNQSINEAQINGVTPLMGNGVSGTGSQRVNVASDNTPFGVKIDQTTPGTTNAVSVQQGSSAVIAEPCQTVAKTYAPINLNGTSGTYSTPIVAGTSAKKTYVCQLILNNNAAITAAVVEATTGTSCGTVTAGVWGGTTTGTGFQFAANGGVSLGNGSFYVGKTATNNNDICVITNSTTQLTGGVLYVQL